MYLIYYITQGIGNKNHDDWHFCTETTTKPLLSVPHSTVPFQGSLHVSLVIHLAKALPETGHIPVQKPHMTFHCLNLTGHSAPSPTRSPHSNQACQLTWPAINLALALTPLPCPPGLLSTSLDHCPPHHLISKQAFKPQLKFSFIQKLSRPSLFFINSLLNF